MRCETGQTLRRPPVARIRPMHEGHYVFAQLMQHLPLTTFRRCVARYRGECRIKRFSCLDQYLSLAFAQLTWRESLRDIEACLRRNPPSSIIWVSAAGLPATPWPMPTRCATGASMPTSRSTSSASRAGSMRTIRWRLNSTKPSMRWTQPPSISACRYSPGRRFDLPRPP